MSPNIPSHQQDGEGTQPGQLTQTDQRDVPYCVMPIQIKTLSAGGGAGHHLLLCCLSSGATATRAEALLPGK